MKSFRKPEVKATVSIDGEKINFIRLSLSQEMGQHHDFEILIDHKTFDKQFMDAPEKKLNLIYTKVTIDLQHGDDDGKAYLFTGLVTDIELVADEGNHGSILVKGSSPTIELERGGMQQSFSSTNLRTILNEVTANTIVLAKDISPEWNADIDFALQYGESDWHFVQRICSQYAERQYYTGIEWVVGPHPEFPTVELTHDMELRTFRMCSRLSPNGFSTYQYRREDHTTLRADSPGDIEGAGNTLQQISGQSDYLTRKRKPNVPSEAWVPDMGSLIDQNKRRKVATGGRMQYIKGIAKTCDVRIGRLVHIRMAPTAGGTDMGTYRVYKILHVLDQNGRYHCDFEALPADLKYTPTPPVQIPTPNPIECEVWNNQDPLGLGRLKIKFPFDERPCSIYFPQMTPDAGGNGAGLGPVSRGYSFVAEVGDSILVSFLDQHLSMPFVMGSMFHGKNATNLGGGKGNHIKTIRDKSSGEFIMNTDEGGDWGITIRDRRGDVIHIDTRGQNINITAPETVTITAKNIVMNAEENIESQAGIDIISTASNDMINYAGNDLKQTAKSEILENSDTRTELVDQEYLLQSSSIDTLASEISIFSEEENMTLQSGKVVQINSAEKTNQF